MAGELQASFSSGVNIYFSIWNSSGQIWNTSSLIFETYNNTNYANYTISATEQGSSGFYIANFPTQITAGLYSIIAKQQLGGSATQSDPYRANGNIYWNGTAQVLLSDLATSGQISTISPIKLARGVMVQNFPLYFRSSLDHITAFTSGVVSGQIARDGGSFGPLQSGAFTETGLGFYSLSALTSGDLLANTVKLLFTATGISGGSADPLPISFIMQKSSGSV